MTTNRVFDTALDQAVDVAHVAQGAVHAIGDSISDLLPSQLIPSRKATSHNRGRFMAIFSIVVVVVAGLMLVMAKRRRSARAVHRDGSAYEETAEAAMVTGRGAADRVMAAADRVVEQASALSKSGAA